MTGRITTSLFILALGLPAAAAPSVSDALSDHKAAIELNAAMDEINEEERKRREVLIDLPDAIAKAFLSPTVTDGGFTGDGENPSYVADVEYNSTASAADLISKLKIAIGGARDGQIVCIASGDDNPTKFRIRGPAETALLAALGTSASAIEPVPHFLTEAGDETIVVESSLQGTALFDELKEGFERTRRGGSLNVYLEVDSGPGVGVSQRPAKLILTTIDGRKLNLEVEIDAPAKSIADNVPEGAKWRVQGSAVQIPFDAERPGQIALLTALLKNGKLRLANVERVDNYPIARKAIKGSTYDVHAIGRNNAWYTSNPLEVQGVMSVSRTEDDECDINVGVVSTVYSMTVGPLSAEQWSGVTAFRPVERGEEITDLGYLNGPACASDPVNRSFKAFDASITIIEDCKAYCEEIESKIDKQLTMAMILGAVSKEVAEELKLFERSTCEQNCQASNEYRSCMNDAFFADDSDSDSEGATQSGLDSAYICQVRQPYKSAPKPSAEPDDDYNDDDGDDEGTSSQGARDDEW